MARATAIVTTGPVNTSLACQASETLLKLCSCTNYNPEHKRLRPFGRASSQAAVRESPMQARGFPLQALSPAALLIAALNTLPVCSGEPENLAPRARVTANSVYSPDYVAQGVSDGQIPSAGSRQDRGKAWCVKGATHRNRAELTFEWPKPVTVGEVVYYGRTAWFFSECWKEYELLAGEARKRVAKGSLQCGHGPQRITLPEPIRTNCLTLRFLSSYGGPNPGASEVQVYQEPPPENSLRRFAKAPPGPADRQSVPAVSPVKESPELAADLESGRLGFNRLVVIQRHRIDPSHVYTYHAEGLRPGGGLFLVTLKSAGPQEKRLVDASNGIVLDCNLSSDGRRILFSWKRRAEDYFQVYVINLDGTDLRQITSDASNNMNACWLPDGGIAFLSDRKPAYAYCWVTTSPILHRCEADGSNVVRLSANYLNDFTPSVLDDGRILYSRWEYVDRPAIPIQSLWTINSDGTGLSGYFGNRVLSPATFMEARQIPGTRRVLCVLTSHNGPCRGAIGIVDPAIGANTQEAIRNLTPEINVGRVDEGNGNRIRGPYESPFPLDEQHFLASCDGTIVLRDYEGTRQTTVLKRQGDLGYYSAQPIRVTSRPIQRMSLRAEHPQTQWATVVLQDIYQGLEPHVRRGEITQIAVVQEVEKSRFADKKHRAFGFQFPVVSCGATYAPKRLWGYAKVEPDGSARFKVPSGRPIYFMVLDNQGRALQRMRTFTHFMPGEVQGCTGCHDNRNYSAPRSGSALKSLASGQTPQELQPPEWGVRGFSYAHVVQPVWDKNCVECHNAIVTGGKVDLSGDKTDIFCVSYEILARQGTGAVNPLVGAYAPQKLGVNPYTSWIATYNGMESNILQIVPRQWGSPASKLADLILSGHPDADGKPRVQLTSAERRRVFAWIDLNVPYYGSSESNHYEVLGCRRLLPDDLEAVLKDVAARRCARCHEKGQIPRTFYTRITNEEHNSFLLAPLAKSSGGTQACGEVVFQTKQDPDYQAILRTFDPLRKKIEATPRRDMADAELARLP